MMQVQFTLCSEEMHLVQLQQQYLIQMLSSVRPDRSKEKQYIFKQAIGKGCFGQVEKCQNRQTGKIYAVKTIQVQRLYLDTIEEEANNMIKSNSQYVLELVDHFYDEELGSYILVTPLCKMGALESLMKKQWEFDELLLMFFQLAKGLFDLSKNQILHLDLKPDNVLLKAPHQYVLCDLGCSRRLQNNAISASRSYNVLKLSAANARGAGTPQYASPDLVMNGQMTPFTDIWSLGVILYRIIFKKHPLYAISSSELSKNMEKFYAGKYTISFTLNEYNKHHKPIVDIVERMLVCSNNKAMRISWGAILDSIYDMLEVPLHQGNYIVTNYDNLLNFVQKSCVLASAFLYYYGQVKDLIKGLKVDFKKLIRNLCIFLLSTTKELGLHTKQTLTEDLQFYLFKTTKKHLTKKQKSYASCLQKKAEGVANLNEVLIEYGSVQICRQIVVSDMSKLLKVIKMVPIPEDVVQAVELRKLTSIVEFIALKNEIKFERRTELISFVRDLINS